MTTDGARGAAKPRILLAGAAFCLAAGLLHWDILRAPSDAVLGGRLVGGFFSWEFWWWSHALRHHLPLLHSNLIMFPHGVPLFPVTPVNDLCAVLLQLFTTPYAAVNLLLIAGYALTGMTAFVLFRRMTGDTAAAFCGAYAYAFSTYMLVQHWLGQVGEATLFFNPLLIIALDRLLERPTRSAAGWLFLALCGVVLSGPYVAFSFGFIYLAAWLVFDLAFGNRRAAAPAAARALGAAVGGALLVAVAAYWPLLRHRGEWLGGSVFHDTALLSFLNPPFWHRSALVQELRPFVLTDWGPERSMGYLGLGSYALLACGLALRDLRGSPVFRLWLWILGFSAVLALGPLLSFYPGRPTAVPLPYLLLSGLPILGEFRVSGRILMTVTLASSAITALVLSRLLRGRSAAVRAACAAGFVAFWTWEFDLLSLTGQAAPVRHSRIHQELKADRSGTAVLELPDYYDAAGDLFVFGQSYMLSQVYHGRPLVLGYPSRYLAASLEFTERTPYLRELTHPWLLSPLRDDARARRLAAGGSRILSRAGIGHVVLHSDSIGVDAATAARLREWLDAGLGPPVLVDGPDLLYRTGPRATGSGGVVRGG